MTVTGAENYTTAYTYDANNRLLTEAKTENSATVTTTYTYDANGNNTRKETADSITANTYNNFNQLIQVGINGLVATYEYNAQGIRTAKTVGETETVFLLDGGNVVAEIQGNTTTTYLRGVNLINKTVNSATEYYSFSAHGDVVNLTNSTGTTTKTYDYDAFGNERNPDETDSNPFRYCGEYWDQETCTYYLRARYYDPAIGRFTQADSHWNTSNMIYGDNPQKINEREDKLGLKDYTYIPQLLAIVQAGNVYAYCLHNPVNLNDSGGQFAVVDDLALAGTAVFFALIYITYIYISNLYSVGALAPCPMPNLTSSNADWEFFLAYIGLLWTGAVAAGSPEDPNDSNDVSGPRNLKFDKKQVGKKYGEHRVDYQQFKSYQEYMEYAKDIFSNPEKIIYDVTKKEYYYIRGSDLLRVSTDGYFISLYPGAASSRVIDALAYGVVIYGG